MGLVYFIKDEHKRVKMGYTDGGVVRRLKSLQLANADLLTIVGILPGTKQKERRLQKQFQSLHVRGEWYRLEDELKSYIKTHTRPPLVEKDYRIVKIYPGGSRLLKGYIYGVLGDEVPPCPKGCELEILHHYNDDPSPAG